MNPALGARCFLLIAFAANMTNFTIDAYTGATPLAAMRNGGSGQYDGYADRYVQPEQSVRLPRSRF